MMTGFADFWRYSIQEPGVRQLIRAYMIWAICWKTRNLKEWNTPANCKRESMKSWKRLTVYKKYIDVICASRVKNMRFCSFCMKSSYPGTKSRKNYKFLREQSKEGENVHWIWSIPCTIQIWMCMNWLIRIG